MVSVFTYGSLMFDPVWSRVVAGSYERCEAILQGYDRKAVRGETYPVLMPSSALSQVQGVVYCNVSSADLARLDHFEGEYISGRRNRSSPRKRKPFLLRSMF